MKAPNFITPPDLFGILRYSFELLYEPAGIFLFLCTIVFICIAMFSWPKRHTQSFLISFPFLFLSIILFFYHAIKEPSADPILYIEGIIKILPFGIGYSLIYIIFYWLSIGIAFLCSRKIQLSTTQKCILCILTSIILWIFSKLWFSLATFITLLADMLLSS